MKKSFKNLMLESVILACAILFTANVDNKRLENLPIDLSVNVEEKGWENHPIDPTTNIEDKGLEDLPID